MHDFYSEYVLQKAQTGNMKRVVSGKGSHCIVCTISIKKDKWYVFTSSSCYKCEAKITQRQEQVESQPPFVSSWASELDSCLYTFRTQLSIMPFYTIIPATTKKFEQKKNTRKEPFSHIQFPRRWLDFDFKPDRKRTTFNFQGMSVSVFKTRGM